MIDLKLVAGSESLRSKYPFKEAYKAIEQDNVNSREKNYIILEDASVDSFLFYARQNPQNFVIEMKSLSFPISDKLDWLNLYLNSQISKTYYFFKVTYGNEEPVADFLQNVDFKKKIILSMTQKHSQNYGRNKPYLLQKDTLTN